MAHLGHVLYLCLSLALGRAVTVSPSASAPGDVIIGGIFPIHKGIRNTSLSHPSLPECSELDKREINNALIMIQAVESINSSPMLGGVRLGYRIYDSCGDVTTALYATKSLMSTGADCVPEPNSTSCPQPIMAVIGAAKSEVSIAVARQLTLELIPQISYESTAVILSDKNRFPAFMRTVPNDNHQTRAMVKLLSDSRWNWVGMVIADGDYGRSALNSFVSLAAEAGICVAFKEILPGFLSDNAEDKIRQAVETIRSNPKVKVIVSFTSSKHMSGIFKHLGQGNVSRVWIASDAWSTSQDTLKGLSLGSIGTVVGFTFKKGNLSSFRQYLRDLHGTPDPLRNNSFLKELSALQNQSQGLGQLPIDTLIKYIKPGTVFSINIAIGAIASAVAKLCSVNDSRDSQLRLRWKLLAELKESTFQVEGENYKFDLKGDLNLGYDIILWKAAEGSVDVSDVVAHYDLGNHSFSFTSQDNRKKILALQEVESRCSPTCQLGQFKKTAEGQHTCCYECINCTENQFSNSTDMDQCFSCDTDMEWAPAGHSCCIPKTMQFFSWQDGFAVVLLTLAALGILLALMAAALFLRHRHTPVVKAAGGPICQLVLLSLAGSFVSTILFVGRPTNLQCQVRQVLYGLSFTCCVSCILVKSLKILLAFHFNPSIQEALRRLYRPYWIIGVCVGLQALLCTLWLLLNCPLAENIPGPTTILVECSEGSYVAFGAMLGYIALLALVCFGCAFKGRKLPESYNEAKFITFGMLIYFISWVIFVPVYVTTSGTYLPAVEMVVILISNYGILTCHFLPKCYIILFKKEANTKDAFLRSLYAFSTKSSHADFSVSGKSSTSFYSISESFYTPKKAMQSRAVDHDTPGKSSNVLIQDQPHKAFCRKRNASI